jgi:hypothetical protein
MWTSAGFRINPSIDGCVMIGAFGGWFVREAAAAVAAKMGSKAAHSNWGARRRLGFFRLMGLFSARTLDQLTLRETIPMVFELPDSG